jgi:hypothetical protein
MKQSEILGKLAQWIRAGFSRRHSYQINSGPNNTVTKPIFSLGGVFLVLVALAQAQVASTVLPLVLDNGLIRVSRLPADEGLRVDDKSDRVVVSIPQETATFISRGAGLEQSKTTDLRSGDLVIELKKHWDAEMRPCSYPMKCTHETQMGSDTIAWTTTLFTNGFVTAATHKLVRRGTLASSYYTAKGSDRILVIPFTDLDVSFDGIEESLKAGHPYFSAASQVEVTTKDTESRWLVLRINDPSK